MAVKRSGALLFLAAVVLLSLVFLFRVKDEMADFEVNYQAGERIRSGETLYRTADGHWQFKYLPFSAFLYLPLTLLPISLAKALWFGASVAATGLIFVISSRLVGVQGGTFFSPAFFAAIVLGRYFLRELQLGQINTLITLLLVTVTWLLVRPVSPPSAGGAGGVLAGLAAALKPYAVVFMPYFGLRKKWSALAAGLAVLALAILAPALFYGWKGNLIVLGEWRSSLAASTPPLLSSQDNVSLIGFLLKQTHDRSLSLAAYVILLAALSGLVLFLVRRGGRLSRPAVLDGFLLLALIPLISPLGWDYTFLSTAPAVILVCRHFDKYQPFFKAFLILNFLVISLSLYDIMGRRLYASFMSLSVITVDFLALVGYLVYLRVKGYA